MYILLHTRAISSSTHAGAHTYELEPRSLCKKKLKVALKGASKEAHQIQSEQPMLVDEHRGDFVTRCLDARAKAILTSSWQMHVCHQILVCRRQGEYVCMII